MALYLNRCRSVLRELPRISIYRNSIAMYGLGDLGSGAGKGGGAGGSVREAGGAFGKMEAAREEEYFRRLQKEQFKTLHKQLHDEIAHHESIIKHHKEAIERHKEKMKKLKEEEADLVK